MHRVVSKEGEEDVGSFQSVSHGKSIEDTSRLKYNRHRQLAILRA